MVNKLDLDGWVARWVLFFEKLDYTIKYKPVYLYKQADHLSRLLEQVGMMDIHDELPYSNFISHNGSVIMVWPHCRVFEHSNDAQRVEQEWAVEDQSPHPSLCYRFQSILSKGIG